MPGFVATMLNVAMCSHMGKATPIPPAGRVLIMGAGVVNIGHVYAIMGCTYPAMTSGAQPPCVSATITPAAASLRVKTTGGLPIAIVPPNAPVLCLPTSLPLIFVPAGQVRVRAT
jgi:hypothetical protein